MGTRFRRSRAIILAASLTLLSQVPVSAADAGSTPIGSHDGSTDTVASLHSCYAAGWALDPDHPEQDVAVRVIADGGVIATLPAGDFRQDLLEAGIADGTAGFAIHLGQLVSPGIEHEIRTEAMDIDSGEWYPLDGTPRRMTCTGLAGTHDTPGGTYPNRECRVEGWAFDGDAPNGPRVQVRVRIDGRVVAEATADDYREDVRDAGYGDGYSGFSIDVYGRLTPNRPHTVTVEERDVDDRRIWLPLVSTGTTMVCLSR